MNFRESSSVDQITCFTPARLAASARFFACSSSLSPEKCSQKLVSAKTPWAPVNALVRLSTLSRSASTTAAPAWASAWALSEVVFRVSARAAKPPLGSLRMARTSPPPWAPVAPTTAMIFLSDMGPCSVGEIGLGVRG